ncbi:hypothetical protein L596_005796 [Steinernema carpocapsae]|uniref:Uncharacterized protein n=1 Tax=Steinernema carpocapsae TaxID=34508 RepID=A0A4U8V060_STECR|nr:hypothetical protein L596_005796 [Steinernema carpocapsae]
MFGRILTNLSFRNQENDFSYKRLSQTRRTATLSNRCWTFLRTGYAFNFRCNVFRLNIRILDERVACTETFVQFCFKLFGPEA